MGSYILIFVSAILGIAGIVINTKKEKDSDGLNTLNPLGYAVLALVIFSSAVSLWNKLDEDEKKEKEKKIAKLEKGSDSLNFITKAKGDSLGFTKTLAGLREQRVIDSTKIITDSTRFDITMQRFGEQARKQDQAIQNLYELQYPLCPVRICGALIVYIDSLENNDTIMKAINKMRDYLKTKKSRDDLPQELNLDFIQRGVIEYGGFKPSDDLNYDPEFKKINKFICQWVLPYIKVKIYADKERSVELGNHWGLYFDKNLEIKYLLNSYNEIHFDFIYTTESLGNNKRIKSLYGCRNGYLEFLTQQNNSNNIKGIDLMLIRLECGKAFSDKYSFPSKTRNERISKGFKVYTYPIEPILSK